MSYWWPKDAKGVIGNDTMAILKSAKNPVLAHQFLNYMLDFIISMKNFGWVGYQPPQNEAPPEAFLDEDFRFSWIIPSNLITAVVKKEDFESGYQLLELDPETEALWRTQWDQVAAGG